MADKSKIGMDFPPYSFEVECVKVKEFVEAIGDDNPIYLNREVALSEGYQDTPTPPTFITLAFQEFTGAYFQVFKELGMPLSKVLHGEEEYEYLGEIYPGDVLSCRMRVESVVEKQIKSGFMDLVTLRTFFINQRGEEVLRSRSLLIERKG